MENLLREVFPIESAYDGNLRLEYMNYQLC